MWPQQRQHHHYRVDGLPDSQQNYELQRSIHPAAIGHPLTPTTMRSSNDGLISSRQNLQHQTMHQSQQNQQRQHSHPRQQLHQQQLQQQQQQQHRENLLALTTSSNPRASRNMAEKQRRDNLNTNISTMATLVPTVAGSPRRLDKISILRLAAAYLRTQYTLGSGTSGFLPRQFNDFDLEQYFIDNLVGNDGFILVVTTTGKIVYISRQIEQQLGHAQNDLFGQSLYNFVFPEDHEELTKNLTLDEPINRLMITEASTADENSNSSEESSSTRNTDVHFGEQRRSFNVRMSQRTVSRREHTQYECLHITGILRPAAACRNIDPNSERAARLRDLHSTSNDVVFVGTARLMKKRITELSLLEANKEEYVTRHLVDGRIIFCDHRISVVAGYMTDEVSGMSAFGYMHTEDVLWTIMALRQMYDRGEGFGSSCYRLKTKTGEYIYLRTHAYVEVDKDRQSFESFICVNTSVSKEEGEKLVHEMKARYSATISNTEALFACEDIKALGSDSQRSTPKAAMEDPSQLENAISHLISDFASPAVSEDRSSPSPLPDTQTIKAALISQHLPPPSIQASKIGIKSINHTIPSIGKDKYQTIKREANVGSPASTHTPKNDNASDLEEPRRPGKQMELSPSRQAATIPTKLRSSDKTIPEIVGTSAIRQISLPTEIVTANGDREDKPKYHSQDTASNPRYASRGKDYCKLEMTGSASSSSSIDDQHIFSESPDCEMSKSPLLQTQPSSTMLVAQHRGKPESMLVYVKTEKTDNGNSEMIERNSSYTIKRAYAEDSIAVSSKKRRADLRNVGSYSRGRIANVDENDSSSNYYTGNTRCVAFVGYPEERTDNERITNSTGIQCKVEQLQGISSNETSPCNVDSPSSSVHDLTIDYHPALNPSNLELTVYDDDEQLDEFPDLQVDPLLSPGLDDNPDFMKIFDDLRPVIGFEQNIDDRTIQQFSNGDQAVSEGLRRTHLQLANRMTLQKNQLCVLERELETPARQNQFFEPMETLTELRAEHKKNTRMLKTIQQDHHNMQVNVKNIGV